MAEETEDELLQMVRVDASRSSRSRSPRSRERPPPNPERRKGASRRLGRRAGCRRIRSAHPARAFVLERPEDWFRRTRSLPECSQHVPAGIGGGPRSRWDLSISDESQINTQTKNITTVSPCIERGIVLEIARTIPYTSWLRVDPRALGGAVAVDLRPARERWSPWGASGTNYARSQPSAPSRSWTGDWCASSRSGIVARASGPNLNTPRDAKAHFFSRIE